MSNDLPLRLSIVTPSFNQARFLRQCADSVLAQHDPNLEYIVMDGGSTDGSVEILRRIEERLTGATPPETVLPGNITGATPPETVPPGNITGATPPETVPPVQFHWTSERDCGQANAVNRGMAQATGEIIGWVNSDDMLEPGALAHVRQCFAQHPEAALVYGRAWIIEEDGSKRREYPTFAFERSALSRKCYVCQPAVFLRRSTIERFGGLNENLDICLDYEWWLRIGREAPLVFCDAILASIRQYGTTKTSARRLRALVEAGYLMRHHFGHASWRWSAKWVMHWMKLHPRNGLGALGSARRFHARFDSANAPSRYGKRVLDSLA